MKGQRTKQQNRSVLFTITTVLLMLVITMIGLTAVVSAEDGQARLNITANNFAEATGLEYENGVFYKVYDGTTDVALKQDKVVTLTEADGIQAGHEVKVEFTSASFNSANVNEATKIDVEFKLTGKDAGLYYAHAVSFNAMIKPRERDYTFTVTYSPNGIKFENVSGTITGLNGEQVTVFLNADLGLLNASDTAYAMNGIATTDNANYVVPTVMVMVNPIVVTEITWVGSDTWTYGSEAIKAYANGDLNIFVLNPGAPKAEDWEKGNVGKYTIEAKLLDAYKGNYDLDSNLSSLTLTKDVTIAPLKVYVSMSDSTIIGNGKTNYSITVDGYIKGKDGNLPIPVEALHQISYQVNGAAFSGFTFGEATVEAIFTNGNYEFLNKNERRIEDGKLTATLKVLRDEKIFDVLDEDGNKVGEVILASPEGFSDSVTAKITALKGFPKITKNKYNMVYNVKINGAEDGQTFTLYIPLTETVFNGRSDDLGIDTLCVYEAATKTLTSATKASKGY